MKRLTIISLLMSIALTSSAQKSLWKSRISFGVEWGYVATFNSGYHYNFFAPEGFRVNPSGNSFKFISNAETYLHIGYDITDDWNISLYAGYAGIADFHHAVPVSIRGTRFFERNSKGDRWIAFLDLGSGICLKKNPQTLLCGKIGGGYRISLSKDTSLDFIMTLRTTLGHPDIDFYGEIIPIDKINRNNAYANAISFGMAVTF